MVCKLATVSMNVTYNVEENFQKYLSYMEQAKDRGAQLVVFPEQSLQGYLSSLKVVKQEDIAYQKKYAQQVPDGTYIKKLIQKAKEYQLYTVIGMTECEEGSDKLYNTMVLAGPEGYVGKYRKVHQPGTEGEVYTSGNEFPVFDTAIGKIGMLICFDKAFPESCRTLALKGADILVMPTAWALSKEESEWQTDPKMKAYMLYDQVRALENQCFFISANQFERCGDLFYPGHSNIVSPTGEILAGTGFEEGMAFAEVDVAGMRTEAKTVYYYDLIARRHPEAYEPYNKG